MFHVTDPTGERLATYPHIEVALGAAHTLHAARYGYVLRASDGEEMARNVIYHRRKLPPLREPATPPVVIAPPAAHGTSEAPAAWEVAS